jgi:hypothetical protein
MEIFSARLASALRESITPQRVPSAKADPLRTALIKALVAPPPASSAPPQPAPPPAFPMLPHMVIPATQRSASAEMVLAYSIFSEAGGETGKAAVSMTVTTEGRDRAALPDLEPSPPSIAAGAGLSQSSVPWPLTIASASENRHLALDTGPAPGKRQASAGGANTDEPGFRRLAIVPASLAAALLVATLVALVLLLLR